MKVNRTRIRNRIGLSVANGMPLEQAELEAQQWARRMRIRERMKENPDDGKEATEIEQDTAKKETPTKPAVKGDNG
jgi:hypothetical protein